MSAPMSFGEVPWTRDDLLAALEGFSQLYDQRPIRDNVAGMRAPHMFAAWFALARLKPKVVVESGIANGQSTWLIEQACPEAELHSIDIDLSQRVYFSDRATYYEKDFDSIDWSSLPTDETVLFFDDHQNAYDRVKSAAWFGFEHLLFEDNYPVPRGDCYSLKKAFAGGGFTPEAPSRKGLGRLLGGGESVPQGTVAPNMVDAHYLQKNLASYFEFPPVIHPPATRWGDAWDQTRYPTPEPLLSQVEEAWQQVFADEAVHYTWLCYARLKR